MTNPDRQSKGEISRSEQTIQNWSFDELYKVLAVLALGEYNGALYRLQVDATGALKISGANITASFSPTFKDDPTSAGETPKYGKTNSTTHKQQVEATIDAALPTGTNTIGKVSIDNLDIALSALRDAIVKTGGTSKTLADVVSSQDPLQTYRISDSDEAVAATVKYYGFVKTDGTWYILKIDSTSNPTSYRYANVSNNGTITSYGANTTSGAWHERANLTYALLYNLTGL